MIRSLQNPKLPSKAHQLSVLFRSKSDLIPKPWIRREDPAVPVTKLKFGTPLSGTLVHDEDLAETHKQEFHFEGQLQALTARGFMRFQGSYEPPPNTRERLMALVKSLDSTVANIPENNLMVYRLTDSRLKYDLLSKLFDEFQHGVPNSMLYMIETIGDVDHFYHTPIRTTTPYDDLARVKDLPPNLHIQKDPVRFHPETDTAFGGVSAYPKSSTIVTGLRTKRKYKGHSAKRTWP